MNKDSKGIAVFDTKGRRNTLKYYFDVSDTHEGYYGSRAVPIWQMDGRYEQAVTERLSDRFGEMESDSLAGVLMEELLVKAALVVAAGRGQKALPRLRVPRDGNARPLIQLRDELVLCSHSHTSLW